VPRGPQGQAEKGAPRDPPDQREGHDGEHKPHRTHGTTGQRRQTKRCGKRFGAAQGGDARPLPGTEDQPQRNAQGHEIEPQAGKNLVDPAPHPQPAGKKRPGRAAADRRDQRQGKRQPRR